MDVDAPLMEAGVDSLGAVELRSQLQCASGSSISLPSTIIFDHPTARQLAAMLQTEGSDAAIDDATNAIVGVVPPRTMEVFTGERARGSRVVYRLVLRCFHNGGGFYREGA